MLLVVQEIKFISMCMYGIFYNDILTMLSGESAESPLDRRVGHYRQLQALGVSHSIDLSLPNSPTLISQQSTSCKVTILFVVLHGGRL